jgi:hypothetical protein
VSLLAAAVKARLNRNREAREIDELDKEIEAEVKMLQEQVESVVEGGERQTELGELIETDSKQIVVDERKASGGKQVASLFVAIVLALMAV